MKAQIRIPTTQYGYIEAEVEGTSEQIVEKHNELLKRYNGGFGLEDKEFNAWLDKYILTQTGNADKYAEMNVEQMNIIQSLKKSVARIKSKQK